jgi:hypothetical protein
MSWASNLAAADAAVAGYFDQDICEAIAMTKPARSVNAAAALDVSRPSFLFVGTIELDPDMTALGTTENPTTRSPGDRKVAKVCLSALVTGPVTMVETSELVTGWPWMLRQGDQVLCAGVRYQISASPDRDGTARLVLWLNKVAG